MFPRSISYGDNGYVTLADDRDKLVGSVDQPVINAVFAVLKELPLVVTQADIDRDNVGFLVEGRAHIRDLTHLLKVAATVLKPLFDVDIVIATPKPPFPGSPS